MTTPTAAFDDLLDGNARFADAFTGAGVAKIPSRGLVVLTCMDARVDPWRALGLGPGEAHVLRNAGGRASADVARSIAVSAATLGTTRVAVVHHTDCGMLGREDDVRGAVRERGGVVDDAYAFLTFDDVEGSVRDDVRSLRASPLLPDDLEIAGFLYDVTTGGLRAVPAG